MLGNVSALFSPGQSLADYIPHIPYIGEFAIPFCHGMEGKQRWVLYHKFSYCSIFSFENIAQYSPKRASNLELGGVDIDRT